MSNLGRASPGPQAGQQTPEIIRQLCVHTRGTLGETEAAQRGPSAFPACQWFAPNTPPRAASAAARPSSGCCRALYPVSARPRLCRRCSCRDAVPVALRVPGIQSLSVRLSEGTVRPGLGRGGLETRRWADGQPGGRGAARRPGRAPRAPGRGGRAGWVDQGRCCPGGRLAEPSLPSASRGSRGGLSPAVPHPPRRGRGAVHSRARPDARLRGVWEQAPQSPLTGCEGLSPLSSVQVRECQPRGRWRCLAGPGRRPRLRAFWRLATHLSPAPRQL